MGTLHFFVQAVSGQPGLLRAGGELDRFAAELNVVLAAGGSDSAGVSIEEVPLLSIVPSGPTLLYALDDLAPLVKLRGKTAFRETILLGTRPGDASELLAEAAPAGIIDTSALALWRKGRLPDRVRSGITLRKAWFDDQQTGTAIEDGDYALARPQGLTLTEYLAGYLSWLRTN